MREIRRPNCIVPTLGATGLGGMKARQHETDRAADSTAKLSFPTHWNEPDVRGMLYVIHGWACAYCNCNLPRNDRGDVEHFRPKGKLDEIENDGYWWIAYSFSNYLLSCSQCNRVRKRSYFPLRPRGKRVTYDNRKNLHKEARMLLDPAIDPVEEWLKVDWTHQLCRINPQDHLTGVFRKQVEETLVFFKINSDPELVRERIAIRNVAEVALANGHIDDVQDLAIRYRPHSLVAKQILVDRAPDLLPTPEHELRWLLIRLFESLELTRQLHAASPDDIQNQRMSELLWSLAVLWHDSLSGGIATVENFLTERGILEEVRDFYNLL